MNLDDMKRDVARELCHSYEVVLSVEALRAFSDILKPLKVLRNYELVAEGQVCDCMYYVKQGLVLQYYNKNSQRVTEHISHEGDMVICIESYLQRQPSRIIAKTLEPSVIFGIPYDELMGLASHSFEICKLIFAIYQRSLVISQRKADLLRFESAKERYVRTLRENPEIIRRAPLHYVASLLQITPETLSRVRTQVAEEKEGR